MCTVSNIGDYWTDRTIPYKYPNVDWNSPVISIHEFEQLKKDVEALKELLKAAKHFDEVVGEPDCEHEEKVALIKKIADLVGVDLKGII